MKKLILILAAVLLLSAAACAEPQISWRYADAAEGAQLLRGNSAYYENFSPNDLAYRLQKPDGTAEEWLDLAMGEVRDFTPEEKAFVDRAFGMIEDILRQNELVLPPLDEIVMVKTTMAEESDAGAYTHGSQIYIGELMLSYELAGEAGMLYFTEVMCHELFHCLTRSNPDFRAEVYGLIGFSVLEEDFPISPGVRERFISNPDVERHNSYAAFTINGEKTDCYTVFYAAKPWTQPGDNFFDNGTTALIPVDRPDVVYTMDDASDFWDVFGRNTDYVIDPEECLADNFALALLDAGGYISADSLPNPEIPRGIQALLAG